MGKIRTISTIGAVLGWCIVGGIVSYIGWDLHKHISFNLNRPKIIQEIHQTGLDLKKVNVKLSVKQDPYWNSPERITYLDDRETLYKKLENGEWEKQEGIWTYGPNHINELQFEIQETRKVTQNQIPGNPKNALAVLVDLNMNEEYAEADFEIKKNYETTKKEAEEWASNTKPLLLQNYKHLLKK